MAVLRLDALIATRRPCWAWRGSMAVFCFRIPKLCLIQLALLGGNRLGGACRTKHWAPNRVAKIPR